MPADGERRGELELAEGARRGPWSAGRGLPPVPHGPALHRERVHASDVVGGRPGVAGLPLAVEARQPLGRRTARVHVVGAVHVEDRGLLQRPAGRQAPRHGLHVVSAMLQQRHACAVARVDLGREPGESGDGDVVGVVAGQVGGGAGVGDTYDRGLELRHDAGEHGEEVAVPVVEGLPHRRPVGQQARLDVLEVVAEDRDAHRGAGCRRRRAGRGTSPAPSAPRRAWRSRSHGPHASGCRASSRRPRRPRRRRPPGCRPAARRRSARG